MGDQKANVEVIGKGAMVSNANRGCSDTTQSDAMCGYAKLNTSLIKGGHIIFVSSTSNM